MKENLWRARKLFQCYLRFVFVPSIYEWCLSATICFMLCVPFYFVFIWFHFWLAVYWILVHREFVRLLKCECSFPPTQIRWKKTQLFQTSEISKIHLQWNFVKCPLTVISLFLSVFSVNKKLKLNWYTFFYDLAKKNKKYIYCKWKFICHGYFFQSLAKKKKKRVEKMTLHKSILKFSSDFVIWVYMWS